MAIEQIFIFQYPNFFQAEYLGVMSKDDFIFRRGKQHKSLLPEFESILTSNGFAMATEDHHIRIWTRNDTQLALANGDSE